MTETAAPQQASSKSDWKKRALHKGVTLPSGATVDIKLPDLTQLAQSGTLPAQLMDLVTKIITGKSASEAEGAEAPDATEILTRIAELHSFLVAKTVVHPSITEDEVDDLPPEDVAVLVEFALRERDMDVLGRHLAGLEKIDDFRRFRQLPGVDEDLQDA